MTTVQHERQVRTITNAVTIRDVDGAVNAVRLLCVSTCLNGVLIHMLVDTGAVVSLLNICDFEK